MTDRTNIHSATDAAPAGPLHVVSRGSGQPVVLLHSGGMSSRQWRKLTDALGTTHRTLAVDFLGSGENPLWPDDTPFDYALDIAAVRTIVREAGEPVHLVGHSYGGLVALSVLLADPTSVRSITVYDPVAFGVLYAANDEEGLADLSRSAEALASCGSAKGGDAAWLEWFVDYWSGPGAFRALPAATREGFLRVGGIVFGEVSSLLRDRTPASAYGDIDAPALLLSGERSPPAARRVAELLAAAFPHGRLRLVEGAGHMGPLTHTREVNEAIVAHIVAAS